MLFHERASERNTERFRAPPGVGQNVAWALTRGVNFSRIIDDLWYRDISDVEPAYIEDFGQVSERMRWKSLFLIIVPHNRLARLFQPILLPSTHR